MTIFVLNTKLLMMEYDIEFQSIDEIKTFQEDLLHKALRYLKEYSPYYQRMFDTYEIDIERILNLEDLIKIPFTEKKDLQLFNEDFLCCPKNKIIDYITTSGTLGDPVTFACTDSDLDRLAFNEEKSFRCAGLKPGNILQLMTTIDKRFMKRTINATVHTVIGQIERCKHNNSVAIEFIFHFFGKMINAINQIGLITAEQHRCFAMCESFTQSRFINELLYQNPIVLVSLRIVQRF